MTNLLDDLISEGKKSKREEQIKRAAQRVRDADSKKPLENGPPIRRDVYQQLEWRALSVTLVTVHTTCRCCGSTFESPNSGIFIERYHRRHGRHLVEAHNFNLLPKKEIEALPRKLETRYVEALYCQRCFLNQQDELCLQPTMQTLESSPHSSVPCVPQEWATPSIQLRWSDTLEQTLRSMNSSSKQSEPSKPNSKAEYY